MNSDSPIPELTAGIFALMQGWTYDSGGYRDGAGPICYLFSKASGDGTVEWDLAGPVPSWSTACLVTSGDNDKIQDSSLDGYVITDSHFVDRVLHENSGDDRAYLADL